MMDKTKEKAARTPAIGVAGEQPSNMYNNTIIADTVESGNLQTTYEERDGIFYPLISMEEEHVDVGKYGLLWMDYMKSEYPQRYVSLKRCCRLREKAAEVNEEAYRILDEITNKYLKGKVEHSDFTMEMWKLREQARMMAEEIIFAEIVNQFH